MLAHELDQPIVELVGVQVEESQPSQALDLGLSAGELRAPGPVVLAHNVRSREEVAAVLSEAEAAGGRILRPASAAAWGGWLGFFADPEGVVWEVAWNPAFPLDAAGSLSIPE